MCAHLSSHRKGCLVLERERWKKLTQHDEQGIKGIFIQKFSKEIDSSLKLLPFPEYKEYILRSVNNMDPGDKEAREGRCFGLSSCSAVLCYKAIGRGP